MPATRCGSTLLRGKDRIQREVELAAKLEPFQHGFLGILPMRTAEEKRRDRPLRVSEESGGRRRASRPAT